VTGLQPSVGVTRALMCATAAGIAFIGIQATAWIWLTRAGVHPASGIVASVVYALTVFHSLHALAAIVAVMPLLIRAARRRPIPGSSLAAVSSFWHLVTVAWMVVFLAVFVV
jgi:heme/copper-type cytochrome/quinol oxidase subunit 3